MYLQILDICRLSVNGQLAEFDFFQLWIDIQSIIHDSEYPYMYLQILGCLFIVSPCT